MHSANQGDRRIAVGKHAQRVTNRAGRRAHAFPDAPLVDRHASQVKSRFFQLGKIRRDQTTPLLPLATLHGELGCCLLNVFEDRDGVH